MSARLAILADPDAGAASETPPWQLPIIDATKWIGRQPPDRHFIVDQWLATGSACVFVGEDGVGKSLLGHQLITCCTTGKPFLGMAVKQCPALYVTCEDDVDELWRRQRAINQALGVPIDAVAARLSSLRGMINVALGVFDPEGNFVPSPVYEAIAEAARAYPGSVIVLDNLAHFFPGNENVRREVAAFCSALDSLAANNDATVVMIGHPSKGGAEYSGSTGWSAHVRQRWFMERPEGGDRDARVLRKSKANYAESGTEIAFRWHDWAFVRDEDLPDDVRSEIASVAAANAENEAFMRCLVAAADNRRAVSHNPGTNYFGTVFPKMTEGKSHRREAYERAFERLLHIGAIELDAPLWQDTHRHWKQGIRALEKCGNPPAVTPCGDLREPHSQVIENAMRETRAATPLYTTYKGGAPEGPPPVMTDSDWDRALEGPPMPDYPEWGNA